MEVLFQNQQVKWINLYNPSPTELEEIAFQYGFLKLTIEDSLEPGHLPKFESDENISFLLVRFFDKEKRTLKNIVREFSHKISIYFGKDFIITVHQKEANIFNRVIEKYINKTEINKVTRKGIIYNIINETLKTFETPATRMDEEVNMLEELIFSNDLDKLRLHTLYHLKREASACRKILDYTLDALNEYTYTNNRTSTMQDLKEDCIKMLHLHTQIVDDVQNLLSIYLSLNSQKSNDIMKTLTIFSAFFLPLTFIVGIYGMNFNYMPELTYKWGYPICILSMLILVIFIYAWFKRKKYL